MKEELVDRHAVTVKKRRLLTVFGVLLSVLLLLLLMYYVNCIKPLKQFKAYYNDGFYQEAYDLYNSTLTRIQSNARKAEQAVCDTTDHYWEEYKQASISRTEMENALSSAKNYARLSEYTSYMSANAEALFASRALFDSGIAHMDAGRWQEAIADLKLVLKGDILYKESRELINTAENSYCLQIIDEAAALADNSDYENAILHIDKAIALYPERTDLKSNKEQLYRSYKEYQKETGLLEVRAFLEDDRLEEALAILLSLREDFPEDDSISDAFGEYEDSYSRDILAQASSLYEESAYEEALAILKPAYKLLPKNEAIAALYDKTAGHLPAWLCDFHSENISLRGTRKAEAKTLDVHGSTYEHAIVYTEPSALSMQTMTYSEGKETYHLNGEYTRLLGTLSIKAGSRGIRNDQTGTFRIYNGEEVIFEADNISEDMEPVAFSLDITDADLLSFSFESGIGLKYILGDLCVYKTYSENVD